MKIYQNFQLKLVVFWEHLPHLSCTILFLLSTWSDMLGVYIPPFKKFWPRLFHNEYVLLICKLVFVRLLKILTTAGRHHACLFRPFFTAKMSPCLLYWWFPVWPGESGNPKVDTISPAYCCSVTQSCLILCDHMDHSTPGFPALHYLPELAQTQVHWF